MTRTPVSAATKRHMSVAAEFRSLSDELDDLPPVVAHSRTEPQASLVRSSSTKRGAAVQPDQHRRVRDLLVRRCQRPSVVRGSGGVWSGVACAILIRCSESVAVESTKKLLNITSA
jgi:hypothetical protein